MTRKNIFQQMAHKHDFKSEVARIDELMIHNRGILLQIRKIFSPENNKKSYSIIDFADKFSFKHWPQRGTSISCSDMQSALGLSAIANSNFYLSKDRLLAYIEYILNILHIVKNTKLPIELSFTLTDVFDAVEGNVHEVMGWLNYDARVFEQQQKVLIFEKDQAVNAVVEVVDEDLAYSIVQYNHHSTIGNIEKKKSIHYKLGKELEPKRAEIRSINKDLEDDIFFILNNLNIRHNNTALGDKYYKAIVASMSNKELEYWYDELFQMELLAFLELNQITRNKKVKDLKSRIDEGDSV